MRNLRLCKGVRKHKDGGSADEMNLVADEKRFGAGGAGHFQGGLRRIGYTQAKERLMNYFRTDKTEEGG